MDWHIITGSKGGIGKTLISLLLLTYYLNQKKDESILVLDLNAMNTDTSTLLLHGKERGRSKAIRAGETSIILKKTYTTAFKDPKRPYTNFVVGYPMNPFHLFPPNDFAQLLLSLKEEFEKTATEFNIKPFQRVIIDTNYHPCNIFPPLDEDYKMYQESNLKEDYFNIWFLWVYRQLKKLLDERVEPDEAEEEVKKRVREGRARENQIFDRTAAAIERIFRKGGKKEIGPLIHTYAPVGLLPTDVEPISFLKGLFGGFAKNDQDSVIDELAKLEKLRNVGSYVNFSLWQETLQTANTSIQNKNIKQASDVRQPSEDNRQLFNDLLYKAVQILSDDESLPVNVFPLSLYQRGLAGYTDKERDDAIGSLAQLTIYKNFRKLLNHKYGE